jgi:uncharacterized membrane-anchored protein YhcB (DUF1043 family)
MTEPDWSPEEERFFRHEAFIAKVLEQRNKDAAKEDLNPSFLRLLESNGMVALITVVLGSILAPIVISSIQNNSARNDQALTEYKQYLERQQETVKGTYELVAKMINASQGLIDVTSPAYSLELAAEEDKATLKEQRVELVKKFNSTLETWKTEEEKLGLLMSYYYYGQQSVLPAWRNTQKAVNDFVQCAQKRYHDYREDPEVVDKPEECQPKREGVRSSLDTLAGSIETSRQYIWQQLNAPSPSPPRRPVSPGASPYPSQTP